MNIFTPELAKELEFIRAQLPEIQRIKTYYREQHRIEQQCTGITRQRTRCIAWAVTGDENRRYIRHGGAETAAIPKQERYPSCRCEAYAFPHRHRSGLCNSPHSPLGISSRTPPEKHRHRKRRRKEQLKQWLKSMGI